ncbi:MAG: hypothetical protein ACOCSD_07130 [Halolamina sp.]
MFNLLLPIVVLLFAVFVGWVAFDLSSDEIGRGTSLGNGFATTWLWWVRIVIPVAIGLTLILGIQSLLLRAEILETAMFLG